MRRRSKCEGGEGWERGVAERSGRVGREEGMDGAGKGEGVASYPGPRVECIKGPGDNWQVVLSQQVAGCI